MKRQADLHHCDSMSSVRAKCAGWRNHERIRRSAPFIFHVSEQGMRASLALGFLIFFSFVGVAHAMSCMIDDSERKALLCYHKSIDGRCMQFGPACETKVMQPAAAKPVKPVSTQSASAIPKK
jgi:hypothetical protein